MVAIKHALKQLEGAGSLASQQSAAFLLSTVVILLSKSLFEALESTMQLELTKTKGFPHNDIFAWRP